MDAEPVVDYDTPVFIGFLVETVLWVAYCGLFLYTVLRWKTVSQAIPMYVATILLFALSTGHYSTTARAVYLQNIPANGILGLADIPTLEWSLAAAILFAVTSFVGDMLMVYRLWVVYKRNYFIVLAPIMTTILGLVCFSLVIGLQLQVINGQAEISDQTLTTLNMASVIGPLITNTLVTLLITGRIYFTLRGQNTDINKYIKQIITTVVECGALLFIIQLVLVVYTGLNIPSQTTVFYTAAQLYGIAPTLVTAGINSGVILKRRNSDPEKTGPVATTRIGITPDTYVMTHMSQEWHDLGKDSLPDDGESFGDKSSFENLKAVKQEENF